MIEIQVERFDGWRDAARAMLRRGVTPRDVYFCDAREGQPALAFDTGQDPHQTAGVIHVPGEFIQMAQLVGYHRDPERWNLLYGVLWRLTQGEPQLLKDHSDPALRRLQLMERAVRRDRHKMRAFVRFRETAEKTFVAWYRPEHYIVRLNADFFVRRFGSMEWAILTPDESLYWDRKTLRYGPGLPRESAPRDDQVEDLWLAYYGSIFNPARIKIAAMRKEMPVFHWDTLPESKLIMPLVREAGQRVATMAALQPRSAMEHIPREGDLTILAEAARECVACELHETGTQVVLGEGPAPASIMLVGEQPGDQEDLCGRPFAGPAGKLLDQALRDAGLNREQLYVTNAVKHFRFQPRGKQRLHKKPGSSHIAACRPWLEAEIRHVRPKTIICLGSSAAQSVIGRAVRLGEERGRWMHTRWAERLLITTHPAALLRMPHVGFREAYDQFVAELQMAVQTTLEC